MSENADTSTTPLPAPGRRWKRDVALGLAIFLCGALAGTGTTVHAYRTHPWRPLATSVDRGKAFMRLKRVLDLNEEQAPKVQAIMARGLGDLRELRRAVHPQADRIIERVRVDVEKELDEQQKVKWNEHFKLIRARWTPPMIDGRLTGIPPKGNRQ